MQQYSRINHKKHNIGIILLFISSVIRTLSLKLRKEKHSDVEPVRLDKKTDKKRKISGIKPTPELILVIIIIAIIIILPLLLYSTGCMESTTYYNRGLI